MVERIFLQCATCQTAIACRTQFGLGKEQIYLFPCPKCGVDLGFTLLIDQKKRSWNYDNFKNLQPYQGEDEPFVMLNFSSDFLVEKDMTGVSSDEQFTPFMSNLNLVSDSERYLLSTRKRKQAVQHLWPSLDRANTHRKRNDFKKFIAEIEATAADQVISSMNSNCMLTILAEAFEQYSAILSPHLANERKLVCDRIATACAFDANQVSELRDLYHDEDKAIRLFDELRALDRQWADLYSFFVPLEIVEYLRESETPLSDRFSLSEKPVDRLKAFHSDCFETLGRILVVASCYEGIAAGGGVGVPSLRRLIPPSEFELTANGAKSDLVSDIPFWLVFNGVFDSKLRNGIGHHSWRYEASSDSIHYENHSKSRGREDFRIPYLEFCIRTRRLYHLTSVAGIYVHSLLRQPIR